jgi:hypothetical protein
MTSHHLSWKAFWGILWLFSLPICGFSQTEASESAKAESQQTRPAYLDFSIGIKQSAFRDYATSPLIYAGTPLSVSAAHRDLDQERESSLRLAYAFGSYSSSHGRDETRSQVQTVNLSYLELFRIPALSTEKATIKIGGQFNARAVFRDNEDLLNNGEGLDVLASLFASLSGTLDLSRQVAKEKKILFLTYTAKKRSRNLALHLHLGLVNGSYRNGFAYLGQGAMLNNDEFFEGYQLNLFSGYRLNSTLAYTVFLQNKNAMRFSYDWAAYSTGGNDPFEMADHLFSVSFLFALK